MESEDFLNRYNNPESVEKEAGFEVGDSIKVNLETEEETSYMLGPILQNELFEHWPEEEQQKLIHAFAGLYKDIEFEVIGMDKSNGTVDIKPKDSEVSGHIMGRVPEIRFISFRNQDARKDGRNLLHDMSHVTLFGVSAEFFSQYEREEIPHYEKLQLDDIVQTSLSDPDDFINQFGNALAYECEELPYESQELLKQASVALFSKEFQIDFMYDSDGETENPLVKIYCTSDLSQEDILVNGLEDIQKKFDEGCTPEKDLLWYLKYTPMTVSAEAVKK